MSLKKNSEIYGSDLANQILLDDSFFLLLGNF